MRKTGVRWIASFLCGFIIVILFSLVVFASTADKYIESLPRDEAIISDSNNFPKEDDPTLPGGFTGKLILEANTSCNMEALVEKAAQCSRCVENLSVCPDCCFYPTDKTVSEANRIKCAATLDGIPEVKMPIQAPVKYRTLLDPDCDKARQNSIQDGKICNCCPYPCPATCPDCISGSPVFTADDRCYKNYCAGTQPNQPISAPDCKADGKNWICKADGKYPKLFDGTAFTTDNGASFHDCKQGIDPVTGEKKKKGLPKDYYNLPSGKVPCSTYGLGTGDCYKYEPLAVFQDCVDACESAGAAYEDYVIKKNCCEYGCVCNNPLPGKKTGYNNNCTSPETEDPNAASCSSRIDQGDTNCARGADKTAAECAKLKKDIDKCIYYNESWFDDCGACFENINKNILDIVPDKEDYALKKVEASFVGRKNERVVVLWTLNVKPSCYHVDNANCKTKTDPNPMPCPAQSVFYTQVRLVEEITKSDGSTDDKVVFVSDVNQKSFVGDFAVFSAASIEKNPAASTEKSSAKKLYIKPGHYYRVYIFYYIPPLCKAGDATTESVDFEVLVEQAQLIVFRIRE